ncbi:MAG: citryl-CoA lyase [candidate division KSB1 bacterium]|nr:citryl-CoA lyase [candidate division KSB1 bacterium]
MNETQTKTAITDTSSGQIRIRGYDITELIGRLSFAEGVYLVLKGELPNEKEKAMMEGILVSSLDHGVTPPSTLAARTVLSGGNPLNTAVAAGIMTIGDAHGGAIEQCARILQEKARDMKDAGETAKALVEELRQENKRMPGYGHRIHKKDPRTIRLLQLAEEVGFKGKHIELALKIEEELERSTGKSLPLNVDGTIAAIISEMGFDWRLGKGFFIISRTPGLVAHVYEEWTREKPMRHLGHSDYLYDGPAHRSIRM